MTRMTYLAPVFALAVVVPVACGADDKVPADQLPAKVTAAVRKLFPAGKVTEAEKETDDGKVVYTVTVESKGATYDVEVTEAGEVTEIAKEITYDALPKAVAAAFRAKYPKAKVKEVAEVTVPGEPDKKYHIEAETAGGKELDLDYDAKGQPVEKE